MKKSLYINDITSSALQRDVISHSVAEIRIPGFHPKPEKASVSSDIGIMMDASGIAIRLVSRKCCGMEPKYQYANGPVVI